MYHEIKIIRVGLLHTMISPIEQLEKFDNNFHETLVAHDSSEVQPTSIDLLGLQYAITCGRHFYRLDI